MITKKHSEKYILIFLIISISFFASLCLNKSVNQTNQNKTEDNNVTKQNRKKSDKILEKNQKLSNNTTPNTKFPSLPKDIESICQTNNNQILTTKSTHHSLILWYSFDYSTLEDESGHGITATGTFKIGPSAFIKGHSAFFDGKEDMITIPHNEQFFPLLENEMTITFWIYLLEDSTGNWRTIIQKGDTLKQLTPSIMLWPSERRLRLRFSTEESYNEGIDSKGILNLKQWTHLSIIISGQTVRLFINGSLDAQEILEGRILPNKGAFHIGKDPLHSGTKCFIDDLKIFANALSLKNIETITQIGVPLTTPGFTRLGCEKCNLMDALKSCKNGYHMCSNTELYAGGFLNARRNGLFNFDSEFWVKENQIQMEINKINNEKNNDEEEGEKEKKDKKEDDDMDNPMVKKKAICCSNI